MWKKPPDPIPEVVLPPDVAAVEHAVQGLWDDFHDAPNRLSAPQAALLHVWSADGMIDNGGLPALVETLGDRGRAVVEGFRTLGLPEQAAVVLRTLALYPTAGATDPTERLSASETWADDGPEVAELDRLEGRYYALGTTDAVAAAGARFVAEHPHDFPPRA